MTLLLKNKIHRCRPLLGTFVEITAVGDSREKTNSAINAAFVEIERIERLMSFHDVQSEISYLNRFAKQKPVRVSQETYAVLKCSQELYELSNGVFDIAVASHLMDCDRLPRHEFFREVEPLCGKTCDIDLMLDQRVRFAKSLCIDLGGIAKGLAVDKAMKVLQDHGVESGLVNAGGDMRCFGDDEYPVYVRHPLTMGQLVALPSLKNMALATTANSYEESRDVVQNCAQVNGRTGEFLRRPFSISVCAKTCMIADALTKIVLALESESIKLLSQLEASAFIIYPDNRMVSLEGECRKE
ncbi:MAG: FAD:protein FMN transferase [Candidatus Omnitrophica bacterium]|nr:FAD:protein FMN transferase [Candidatus Omnitrophota bacterium]